MSPRMRERVAEVDERLRKLDRSASMRVWFEAHDQWTHARYSTDERSSIVSYFENALDLQRDGELRDGI